MPFASDTPPAAAPPAVRPWLAPARLALLLALAAAWRLAGLHDDMRYDPLAYAQYAYNIVHGSFTLRDNYAIAHRLPVIAPTAVAYALLGVNPVSTILWPLLLSLFQIALTVHLGARLFDRATGLLAGLFLAVLPLDVILTRVLVPDVVMAAFTTAAATAWLLGTREARPRRGLLLLAGACLAVAVMTRVYAVVLLVFFAADLLAGRRSPGAAAWTALGVLAVAVPVAALYWTQTGNPLYAVSIQSETFGQRLAAPPLQPFYYPRHLVSPRSEGGLFGLLFMGSALLALLRPDRRRGPLFLWFLPLFLFLQFGTMSLASYRPVFKEVRYITPLCAPLALLAASVVLERSRGAWVESVARRLRLPAARLRAIGLALLLAGLVVHSWVVAAASSAARARTTASYRRAVALMRREPSLPIFFDHWRTGLAFSYQFRFTQGSDFYRGAEDSLRIGRPGAFGRSRFGFLPWYPDANRLPRGYVALDREVLAEARRAGSPPARYLGVIEPVYVYAPPASWVPLETRGQIEVFFNPGPAPAR